MEHWTNALLCQTNNTMTNNKQTKRTTGCRSWLPDLEAKMFSQKKSDKLSTDAEKANKCSDRVDIKGKWRIPSIDLRSIQLVFSSVNSIDQALSSLD